MSVRRIRIGGALLNTFLRDCEPWKSRLPPDTNVLEVLGEDRRTHSFVFLIESRELPTVPEGKLIPFVELKNARRRSEVS
jgi:hypothetical protein